MFSLKNPVISVPKYLITIGQMLSLSKGKEPTLIKSPTFPSTFK